MENKKLKLAWLSDLDMKGSGYFNITTPVCAGLTKRGHEIKISGLGYRGEEHDYPFSIIPAINMQEAVTVIQNLYTLWGFDVLVVALDIPIQIQLLQMMQGRPFKYVAITPLEATPLCMSWAMGLMPADKIMCISKFGTEEMLRLGLNAEYIQIGIDTTSWRIPTAEERTKVRQAFGLNENDFAVLTVADNQERKNLSKALEIIADASKSIPNIKYLLVTREHNYVGWKLRDYAQELGISDRFMIFERGMSFKELWSIYAASDLFLLTSKTEGLGMPLMEAMSVGIPCIGTNCSGIAEVLADNRGLLVGYDYTYRDPFGNGMRYLINNDAAVQSMKRLHYDYDIEMIKDARKYVENRTWEITVDQMEKALQKALE